MRRRDALCRACRVRRAPTEPQSTEPQLGAWTPHGYTWSGVERRFRASPQVADQDTPHYGRPEQSRGRVLEGGNSQELLGHRRVAFGRGQHLVDIGIDDPDGQRPWSLYLGQGQVGADRQFQALLTGLAAARKKRRARSWSPLANVSCRAAA